MKVLPQRFHLNDRSIGFCPQTKKLEPLYKLWQWKGLKKKDKTRPRVLLTPAVARRLKRRRARVVLQSSYNQARLARQ